MLSLGYFFHHSFKDIFFLSKLLLETVRSNLDLVNAECNDILGKNVYFSIGSIRKSNYCRAMREATNFSVSNQQLLG